MIPFPKLHIAESTINRILNTLEGQPSALQLIEPPITADPLPLGLAIDEQVQEQPTPSAVAPEQEAGAEAGALESSLSGGSPFDGALTGALSG